MKCKPHGRFTLILFTLILVTYRVVCGEENYKMGKNSNTNSKLFCIVAKGVATITAKLLKRIMEVRLSINDDNVFPCRCFYWLQYSEYGHGTASRWKSCGM